MEARKYAAVKLSPEQRERLGRAMRDAWYSGWPIDERSKATPWNDLQEFMKENYRRAAEYIYGEAIRA